MQNIEERLSKEVTLAVVQDLPDRFGDVQNSASGAVNNKQKALRRLQNLRQKQEEIRKSSTREMNDVTHELLHLLVGEHWRFVQSFGVRVQRSSQRLEVLNGQSQNGQFVHFSRHGNTGRNHGGQLGDVSETLPLNRSFFNRFHNCQLTCSSCLCGASRFRCGFGARTSCDRRSRRPCCSGCSGAAKTAVALTGLTSFLL